MNKYTFYSILLLPLFIGTLQGRTVPTPPQEKISSPFPEVKNLNDLTKHVETGGVIIVDVYTSWCGACKQMKPVLQKLAKKHSDITVLSHNAESDPSIKSKFNIKYYPTFIIFDKNGKASLEVGGMPEQEMDYLIQAAKGQIKLKTDQPETPCPQLCPAKKPAARTSPAPTAVPVAAPAPAPAAKAAPAVSEKVTPINSMAELQQHQKDGSVVALYIGTTWCGPCKKLKPLFQELAGEMADVKFLSVDGDEVRDVTGKYLKFGFPNIVLFDKSGNHKNIIGFQSKEDLIREITAVKSNGAKQVTYTESREDNPEKAPMPVFKPDRQDNMQVMTEDEYKSSQPQPAAQPKAQARRSKRSNKRMDSCAVNQRGKRSRR